MTGNTIAVSIVSHGQGDLVGQLLTDIDHYCTVDQVILTCNIEEDEITLPAGLEQKTTVIRNTSPKGFGANHNAAFDHCCSKYFCVLNPDIRFAIDPFTPLIAQLESAGWAIGAPKVLSPEGNIEDSFRAFPTPLSILLRRLGLKDQAAPITPNTTIVTPDWMAGMFLLFPTEHYRVVSGFDEKFFMYCEDIDICARTIKVGKSIGILLEAEVIHDARRSSHKNFRHFKWHIQSLFRFWVKHLGRFPKRDDTK